MKKPGDTPPVMHLFCIEVLESSCLTIANIFVEHKSLISAILMPNTNELGCPVGKDAEAESRLVREAPGGPWVVGNVLLGRMGCVGKASQIHAFPASVTDTLSTLANPRGS